MFENIRVGSYLVYVRLCGAFRCSNMTWGSLIRGKTLQPTQSNCDDPIKVSFQCATIEAWAAHGSLGTLRHGGTESLFN